MKFCSKCGKELHDEAVVCVGCGCAVAPATPVAPVKEVKPKKKYGGLATAAKVFCILGVICQGWTLLALAWTLPLTIVFCKKVKAGKRVGVGLKICLLLFVSLLGGIFALCMGQPKEVQPDEDDE